MALSTQGLGPGSAMSLGSWASQHTHLNPKGGLDAGPHQPLLQSRSPVRNSEGQLNTEETMHGWELGVAAQGLETT